jgi:radical S-adenosyl methionine domain-containing protein 2
VDGENAGEDALRNAERYVIEDEEFAAFIERHSQVKVLVPEYSDMMKNSYLILDEYVSQLLP